MKGKLVKRGPGGMFETGTIQSVDSESVGKIKREKHFPKSISSQASTNSILNVAGDVIACVNNKANVMQHFGQYIYVI